jgi:hypothetical protein
MLRTKWVEAGIAVNDGITTEALDRFQEKRLVSLPSAFKEYLLTVNGMKDGQTDENLVSFLSLETIDQEPTFMVLSADFFEIIFAEFSVYSHLYVLRASRNGETAPILATDSKHEIRIASSFEDFVNLYLATPAKIAHCWAEHAVQQR